MISQDGNVRLGEVS